MTNQKHFKDIFSLREKKIREYNKQARKYQYIYNQREDKPHIWRHGFLKRRYHFMLNGNLCEIEIEIIRFRIAGTNHTFAFYGTLFCRGICYAKEFIEKAVADHSSDEALCISHETLCRWTDLKYSWIS
jgi:hypothetical protein